MIGKHRIIVQNKRVKYDFEVRRNITIIRGDSATGKTSLIEMIREYNELEEDSGVELQCDKNCVALSGINWKIQLYSVFHSQYHLISIISYIIRFLHRFESRKSVSFCFNTHYKKT